MPNLTKVFCNKCLYFIPFNHTRASSNILGKCTYFQDYAMSCREDDKKCAIIGKYYEEKIEQPIVSNIFCK